MLLSHLRPLSPSLTHFGRLVDSNFIDLSKSSLSANPSLAREIVQSLYKFGLLVFRNQTHLTPPDEIHLAKLFSHHPSIDDEDENQSYTGGAGTQHRLPQFPQIALVGSYTVKDFYGLTAESKGVYNGWPLGQRAWHCDGLADTHPPPDLTTMRCLSTPAQGGETLFASSVKAVQLLPTSTLQSTYGIHPEEVRVNYKLFDKYAIAPEGTHLLRAEGSKGETEEGGWDVNLKEGTSVPLVIKERNSGNKSMVGTYHVASISHLNDPLDAPPRLGFEEANRYVAEAWKPGLQEAYVYKHQ
ncbi:hypothetical protein ACHAXS_011614 [Conticribra weissflogii]